MLAEQINMNQNISIILDKAGAVFSVLSFPSYISMDVVTIMLRSKFSPNYKGKSVVIYSEFD